MLVISRKKDEVVVLQLPSGDEIDVMVTSINGSHVRLGFDLPDDVELVREELFENNSN